MKVIYLGRESKRHDSLPDGDDDVIELLGNNWNDYGYETFFSTVCRMDGELQELGAIRLLIEGENNSRSALNKLLKEGWDGVFPIPISNYISTPSEIAFYEQLMGALQKRVVAKIASSLRDASFLVHIKEDPKAQQLVQTEGFKNSLQRERGCVEAYIDGWRILDGSSISARDIVFSFLDVFGDTSKITLKFAQGATPLPHDINVLIGPNGIGKSRILHQLVDSWTSDVNEEKDTGFAVSPNISRLIVISYSPFELFPVDMIASKLQDKSAYQYCGLRGRAQSEAGSPIRLSRGIPKKDAVNSLISCIADDQRYHIIEGWGQKIKTAAKVLCAAIDFDSIAFEIDADARSERFFIAEMPADAFVSYRPRRSSKRRFLRVNDQTTLIINAVNLEKLVSREAGVVFLKDGKPQELSSGQRLFTYVVINILGAVKRNSLILIDEPELFLHPSLEVQLVQMLKRILHSFNSRALLATHSPSFVREVPTDCVHVMERAKDGLVIKNPPFQTFGGDVQRISSYVFGDRATSKPFENWIKEQLATSSAKKLIEELGDEINEELTMQIQAMERGQW